MDLDGLELQVDGVRRTMAQWTKDFVDSYYPHIGVDCYRVPAQHFNQQNLMAWGLEKLDLLQPPMPCIAAGDLAHTQVLDALESLSHELKDQKEGPLFIISSVNYDNYLAKLQRARPKKKRKKKKGPDGGSAQEALEAKRMRTTSGGDEFPPQESRGDLDSTEGKEDQGKQLLPPRPADKGGQRGEIDILLLHEKRGIILTEVKSTGCPDPKWTPTEAELQEAIAVSVQKAVKQLDSARDVLHYIMPDLTLTPLSLVIALPFLRNGQVTQALSSESLDPCLRFMCKDDLQTYPSQDTFPATAGAAAAAATAAATRGADTGGCPAQQESVVQESSMLGWWRNSMESEDTGSMTRDTIRTVVGRICGLMSVVSVWTNSKPRVEVRTQSQALGEAGRRVSDIVLLPRQADLLADPTLHRVWITGPMGSGKTLMLQLKGRQWVREGRRVVVINVRTTARGRPIGHVLAEGIRQGGEGHPGAGSVDRHDVALDVYNIDVLHNELAEKGPMDNLGFVVDEVLSDMSVIAEQLALRYPDSPVWCVASYVTPIPKTFQAYRLGAVLRNPPSLQLLLKDLDLNPRHREVYTTRSAARGLSCDGPPIIFIRHSTHDTSVRHLDCLQCANDLADIFESKLGLQLRPPAAPGSGHPDSASPGGSAGNSASGTKSKRSGNTIEATPLSFRDVLILSALPFSTYKYISGYHWEPFIPEVLQYMIYMGTCRFLSGLRQRGVPVKVAVDNTMKEIAFPPKDEVIIADVQGVHSLERKVVVFLRGGGPLMEAEVSEHLSRYQTVQAASRAEHQSPPSCSADTNTQEQNTGPEAGALSQEMLLFASLMYEVRDGMYPQLPTFASPSDHAKTIIHTLLGNMMVAGTQSFVEGKEDRPQMTGGSAPSSMPPPGVRVGAEVRGHLPMLTNVSQSQAEDGGSQAEGAGSQAEGGGSQAEGGGQVVESVSVFLVPDLQEDALGREGEVRRLQGALQGLSEDDQDWEFFAASRCLSQYISILP